MCAFFFIGLRQSLTNLSFCTQTTYNHSGWGHQVKVKLRSKKTLIRSNETRHQEDILPTNWTEKKTCKPNLNHIKATHSHTLLSSYNLKSQEVCLCTITLRRWWCILGRKVGSLISAFQMVKRALKIYALWKLNHFVSKPEIPEKLYDQL